MHQVPAHVNTVIFDVGNTLHHLDHAFIAETMTRHNHPATTHEVALAEHVAKHEVDAQFRTRAAGFDADRRFSYFGTILRALNVPSVTVDAIVADLHAEDVRNSLWRVMHTRTPAVLSELRRRGFTLAVVSNADGRVAAALRANGTAPHFATIVDSHEVGVEKPDPRIFGIALQACNAQPAQAVYVGDIYEIDVRGARGAGMTPVLLDPLGCYDEVDCPRITALGELLDLLPSAVARR